MVDLMKLKLLFSEFFDQILLNKHESCIIYYGGQYPDINAADRDPNKIRFGKLGYDMIYKAKHR